MPKIISDVVLTNLLNYLHGRPYGEVFQGINDLNHLPDAPKLAEPVNEKPEGEVP